MLLSIPWDAKGNPDSCFNKSAYYLKQVLWTKGAERNFLFMEVGAAEGRGDPVPAYLKPRDLSSIEGGKPKKSLLGESYTKRMPGAGRTLSGNGPTLA